MKITVYCGARLGARKEYAEAAEALGTWIGENGHTLVYGGGKFGMMGTLASAVLAAGGEAIGVTPDLFIENEQIHEGITKVVRAESMAERRRMMIELGEAFIALPGGIGTLDEITEIMVLNKLGYQDKPCILMNVCGFYNDTKKVLQGMIDEGFYETENLENIIFAEEITDLNEALI